MNNAKSDISLTMVDGPMDVLGVRSCIVASIAILFCAAEVHAQPLSDEDWMAYFAAEGIIPREFKISAMSPFGLHEFSQRIKPKGTTLIDGKEYRESLVVHDSGPFANQITKTFMRVSDDGLYERDEDGNERMLVPRPLSIGQTWSNGKETFTFERIEDFETFRATISDCLRITAISQQPDLGIFEKGKEEKTIRYYERGKGQIYKNATGTFPVTKILDEYASGK